MVRILYALLLILITASSSYSQQGEFRIEGEISFDGYGDIYVYLVTEEIFKTPFTGIQDTVIKLGEDEFANRKVRFSFEDIAPGTYGIRCFQDLDGNGKLNKGLFGPAEPWGMSWQGDEPAQWPKFEDLAFKLNANINDLHIVLR